ncbi:MAG: PD-(D/E)XK nuclease family protein, partial [Oscillospiraceae bacterium]|nr:PD-(D/E)XK nuclease family protein [Oscillospiraceae bacterium]
GEIRRMVQEKYFTKAEAASLNRSNIRACYRSELFARICRSPWVKREFSFLMDMGREELGQLIPEIGSHRVTVQGIADLIFEEDGAIILVDYKTDHLSEEELVAKYRPQLELYRSILSRLLDKPVKETLIFSMYHKKSLRI